ncbi:MAG: Gfo/Idh/MocA family oxidoreductase [Phycisphaerae bacterium]
MTQPVPVAVFGAGHMGRHHARIYSELPESRLVAVIDPDLDRAKAMCDQHGGQPATSIDDITEEIQAASVAVPTVLHADVGIPLMERGIHILVEKPLAQDVTTAKQLLEASRRFDRVLQVGHSERFNPVVQAMLRLEVTPQFIEADRISPFTFRSADVGVVFDMMIHDIDIVLHLVRDRDYTVDAVGVSVLGDCEDVANARIRFSSGTVVNLTASRLALKTERKIRLFSPSSYITMDYQKKSGIAIKLDDNLDLLNMARERNFEDLSQMAHLDYGSMVKIEPLQVTDIEPLRAELSSFLKSVAFGEEVAVSADEGVAAVDLAERITRQVREQNWVVENKS